MELIKSSKEKEVYSYPNSKGEQLWMYRHKYYDNSTGKRKEKKKSGFKTEKAAIKALYEVKAQTLHGETKSLDNENLTVAQWLDIWFEMNKGKWKVSTIYQREIAIRLQMKPLLGLYKLAKLDRALYQKSFINELQKTYKPNTVRLLHNIFKIAVNAAVEEGILIRNKIKKAIVKTDHDENGHKTENYLAPGELVTLLNATKEHENITSYSFLLTIAYSGVRCGEACGLQWRNIDFDNNTITIERTRTPKTKNSYRTILIDSMVMQQLKKYRTWCMQTLLSYGQQLKDDSFVFISRLSADPISSLTLNDMLRRIQKKAGLLTDENKPKITLHGLRHTHATILLNQGATVNLIAKRLGNTPAMIYDVYGHVLKEMETESVAIFGSSLEASGAKSGANF